MNFKVYVLGKKDVHLLLSSRDSETDSAYEISKQIWNVLKPTLNYINKIFFLAIGYAQNTYVGIKKHRGTTKGLMNLSIPNVLLSNEPNEIHVRIDDGIKIYTYNRSYLLIFKLYIFFRQNNRSFCE